MLQKCVSGILSSGSIHPMTNPSTGTRAWPSQCNLGQLQRLHLLQSSLWGGLRLHLGRHYSSMSPSACLPRPSFLPFNLLFHGCPSQMNILHAELSPESAPRKPQQATYSLPQNAFLHSLSGSIPQATPLQKFCSTYRPCHLFYINMNHPPHTINYFICTRVKSIRCV